MVLASLGRIGDGIDECDGPGEVLERPDGLDRIAGTLPVEAAETGRDRFVVEAFHRLPSMADVEGLLSEWMASDFERNPTRASALGVEGFDDRIGDYSAARWESEPDKDKHWAGRIAALPIGDLQVDEQVDLTLVLATLAGRSITHDWQAWRRDPSIYTEPCFGGVFNLWLHRLRPEEELVAASVARLHQVPDVLADARANLDADVVPALLASRALGGARAGLTYLTDLLPTEVADDALRDLLASAGRSAATAVEDFSVFLEGLETRARGDWAIGETTYSALLRERELLGVDAGELHATGQALYDQLSDEMTAVAAEIDPTASGWPEVLAALDADHPATPDEMRAGYERACLEARAFLVERSLVTLPEGERCVVEPSPVFQRPVLAVASYGAPPPFSSQRVGHFFVPYPPDGESQAGIDQRLASNGWHAIPTTAVHEAYPGHHWHLTWSAATPRPVRKVLRTSYFVEGWALYAERMMHEEGFFTDPRAVLSHLGARLFRAARIVVDTALQAGDMTFDDAVGFLMDKVVMTEAVARAEVRRYCAWPTQAASYLTGSVEIEQVRARWMAEGRGDLHAFHDAMAANPGLPVALAERLLFS